MPVVAVVPPVDRHARLKVLEDPGAGADRALGDGAVVDDLGRDQPHVLRGAGQRQERRVRAVEFEGDRAVLADVEALDHSVPAGGVGRDLLEAVVRLLDVVHRHRATIDWLNIVPVDVVADREDVGHVVNDLRQRGGGVALVLGGVDRVDTLGAGDRLEQLRVVEASRDLGAVGEVLVGVEGGRVARVGAHERGDAAAADDKVGGRGGDGLRLTVVAGFLLGGGVGRLLGLLLGLRGGGLLLLLLRGRGALGDRLLRVVVVIVATADQGEPGGAHAGSGGRAQQRAAREASAAHAAPVVRFAHRGSSCWACGPLVVAAAAEWIRTAAVR